MSQSVYIFGLTGRMGQEIVKIVKGNDRLSLAGGSSRQERGTQLEKSPDIVIDFSLPESLDKLEEFVTEHKSCLVSGTTGFNAQQKDRLKSLGAIAPVFWAANMSFGVYLMCQLTEKLAKYDRFYSYQVEETHHIHKKDRPSGTALIIEEAARKSTKSLKPTLSHREGEVFGLHQFIATSANERLEIKHEAFNRTLFAQGAVDISLWLSQQKPGFYTMDDFFKNFD